MSLERQLPGHIIYAFYSSNCVHKDLFFSFLAIKSIQKSLPDQGEPLWAEDSRKISHSYHSSHDAVLPEELDSVGGGVEPGRQGLGAVPAAHQLLAHHLSALRLHPAARFGSPGVQI